MQRLPGGSISTSNVGRPEVSTAGLSRPGSRVGIGNDKGKVLSSDEQPKMFSNANPEQRETHAFRKQIFGVKAAPAIIPPSSREFRVNQSGSVGLCQHT
jgi:hypothetical protein